VKLTIMPIEMGSFLSGSQPPVNVPLHARVSVAGCAVATEMVALAIAIAIRNALTVSLPEPHCSEGVPRLLVGSDAGPRSQAFVLD